MSSFEYVRHLVEAECCACLYMRRFCVDDSCGVLMSLARGWGLVSTKSVFVRGRSSLA